MRSDLAPRQRLDRLGGVFQDADRLGLLAGAALCWTSGFVKDLAVHPESRSQGIGEALMRHVFLIFRERGATHVDLKSNSVKNTAALRLYERLGMIPVDWEG
ncbi:MAG: GNAT family N-acetyltransferase [Mesorhizobium sp.]|nr:MAG: GNAT family N-acetyltransferase [Mesorhizobium sp.]